MPSGYRLPWKKSVPEPAEPPMTKPALITLKEMPPLSAYAGESSVTQMRVSNAIRLERNADVARIDGMMEGPVASRRKAEALCARFVKSGAVYSCSQSANVSDRNGLGCISVIIPGRTSIAEPFMVQRPP